MPAWALEPDAPRVERYVLGPELGHGGMGRVHLAWDPMLHRLVAVKLIFGHDPMQQLRFLREARSQARIEHPNVCRIFDLGAEGDRPYIAMELIQGPSLAEVEISKDFLKAAALMAEVAEGIHAAHLAGLIHRDLKPSNILVGEDGQGNARPCVVDFGLARDLSAMDQTLSWAVMGTPAFMSPEQARGEALGPATDIYSLGATLFALLTGHPPFECTTLAALFSQQSASGVRGARKLNPAVPKDLETILLKCLETEAHKRYGSAEALAQDLRRFLAGEPILARPVGPVGRLWRWTKRKPALAATAAAGILLAAGLGGWNVRTARLADFREQAAQRFGLEIRDAEHLLRIERMMPTHDIRPAEARLRERMALIRREMEAAGGASRGPGFYALGRGHMALREHEAAKAALEAAWGAGYQSPEVAYALGLAALQSLREKESLVQAAAGGPLKVKALREAELPPALAWLDKAKGAKVEVPEFGQGLLAEAQGDWPAAEAAYRAALAKAPWMFEAWRALAHVAMQEVGSQLITGPGGFSAGAAALARALEHLRQAERLAPSDEANFVVESGLHVSWFISESASKRRSPEPIRAANAALDRARLIRPDSVPIISAKTAAVMQSAFLELSTGGDPGPAVRETAREYARIPREAFASESEFLGARTALHHLWWIAAESDWRFGRDPRSALAEAARMRAAVPTLDPHYAFTHLLEARDRIRRGEDPAPIFELASTLMRDLEASRGVMAWNDTIWGELLLEKAQWLLAKGTKCSDIMAEAARRLERTAATNPTMVYTFYYLPRLRALQARCALRNGMDARPFVRQAVDAARKGVAVNPQNAEVRLAAAEACLADAQVRAAARMDPRPALDAAGVALRAAEATNPRHFRAALLRGELALEAAAWAARSGADAGPSLRKAEAAVRDGQRLKADEPAFKTTLARIQKLRSDPRAISATTM